MFWLAPSPSGFPGFSSLIPFDLIWRDCFLIMYSDVFFCFGLLYFSFSLHLGPVCVYIFFELIILYQVIVFSSPCGRWAKIFQVWIDLILIDFLILPLCLLLFLLFLLFFPSSRVSWAFKFLHISGDHFFVDISRVRLVLLRFDFSFFRYTLYFFCLFRFWYFIFVWAYMFGPGCVSSWYWLELLFCFVFDSEDSIPTGMDVSPV